MLIYVDTSVVLKRYVEEPESDQVERLLHAGGHLVTARHTAVEVRRNLVRLVEGAHLPGLLRAFARDLRSFSIVELDRDTCEVAAIIAEQTGARTSDALHLGAAQRIGTGMTFLTFDVLQATAATLLGFRVVGA